MIHLKKVFISKFFIYLSFLFVVSCSSIPRDTANICELFDEKYFWYKSAKSTQQKWGVPIELQMAIIKQESGFDWLAQPERLKIFKIIPWRRPSSSLGYSQAVDGTWELYKSSTGNDLAVRVLFKDSSDFIGWYVDQTYKKLKIPKDDYFRQYIAYHEGWNSYSNYNRKPNVVSYAKAVSDMARTYRSQLERCSSKLNKNKYILF